MNSKLKFLSWALLALVGIILVAGIERSLVLSRKVPHAIGVKWHQPLSRTGYPGTTAGAPTNPSTLAQVAGQPHPFRVVSPHHLRMAGDDSLAFLKNAQRLTFRDDRPNADGVFRRVSLYRTTLKYPMVRLEETLQREPDGHDVVLAENASSADHVIMRAQPGESADDVAKLASSIGDTVLKPMRTQGYFLVQLPAQNLDAVPVAVQTFGQHPDVARYVEPDQVAHALTTPNDPDFTQEWSMNNTGQTGGKAHADISAVSAWSVLSTSPNVLVAVIDTGIDFNHPDLAANIWTNPHPGSLAGYTGDLHGWNFVADNNSPQDDNFHGTHVSGTIGAIGNNGAGVAGVTWHVKLMPLKFLGADGTGFASDAVDAVNYATAMGARIMSNSWGGLAFSQSLKDAINAANNAGILFVVAAGNDGIDTDETPTYPSCYTSSNIISVAASDDNDQLASFSNYGTSSVELAAPGVGIVSTLPTVATAAMTSDGLTTSYGPLSGTSMATPLVSGAAALALAQNSTLTVAQLKSRILQRTDALSQLVGVVQTEGRLDLYNVVNTNWSAGAAALQLSSTTFSDAEGNGDGTANPGEIIDLAPVIYNAGGTAASNVTVQMVSEQSSATVLSGTATVGTLLPKQSVNVSPFRIQLSNTVTVGTTLTFNVVIQGAGLTPVTDTATVLVQPAAGYSETPVAFKCGEIKADTGRNQVYAVDLTNNRVLAIDTNLGQTVAAASLASTTGAGQMAVSLDDTKLYVALPAAQMIQVFSLPSLTPLATLPVNFMPFSLACGSGGRLYASFTLPPYGNATSAIYEVDPTTGQILQGCGSYDLTGCLLRTSSDGTKLYAALIGYSGGEPVDEFSISGTTATLVQSPQFSEENLIDFAVDDANDRIYLMNGGIYGVNLLNLATGDSSTVWPLGSAYAVGVAFLPSGSLVYGASGDAYAGGIVEYNRSNGAVIHTFTVGLNGYSIQDRGIAVTPNGSVLYVKSGSGPTSTVFGLTGGKSLQISNPPAVSASAKLSLAAVAFSDSEGNGDGGANSGEIVDLTPSIANTGGAAAGATISLAGSSTATILAPASQAIASVAPGGTDATSAPFRIKLASSLAVGTVVHLTFTVTPASGSAQTYPYQLVVQPDLNVDISVSKIAYGDLLGDQQRDIVYMVDKTDMEILAFDTDAGHVTTTAPMYGTAAVNWSQQSSGRMAESTDGTHLFVALPQTNMIQELALPALTTVAHWSYSFQPVALACDAKGRLYCTTTDQTQKLVQINTTTGAVLTQSGAAFVTSTFQTGSGTILRSNAAGTEVDASFYDNQDNAFIYRYSTTGGAAPTQISALPLGSGGIQDFALDETTSVFDVILGNGAVTVVPISGAATSSWSLNTQPYGGDAVSVLPGDAGVLAALDSLPSYIRLFSSSGGQDLYDYQLNDTVYSLQPRGMATTPNGRTLYLSSTSSQPQDAPTSVDGNYYKVGVIGGSVDLQPPGPNPIGLQSLALTDPAPGSNDGYVHPGQTIRLAPIFKNFLNFQITGVSLQVATTSSLATVQAPAASTIGNVASFATFSPSIPFSVAISSIATDGEAIPLSLTVSYDDGAQQIIPYTLYVDSPVKTDLEVGFQIGAILADPTRDLAYVVDVTDQRLLAINTDTGTVSKSMTLLASPGVGLMALSADGNSLYIALTASKQIQVVSLLTLQQSDIINLDFEPASTAAGADGKLYVSSADSASEYLRQVDPATGETVGTFGHEMYYPQPVLKTNGDHSAIYVGETGIIGDGNLDAYSINNSSLPTFQTGYPFDYDNLYDLAVDDTYQRIYSVSGGTYGVGVTDLVASTTTTWSDSSNYAPYGEAVCFLPGGGFIYGGSSGEIRRYNRADGTPLADLGFSAENAELMERGLAMTANGRVLYATAEFTGNESEGEAGYLYRLGLIGGSSLTLNSTTAAPAIYAGQDQSIKVSQSASLAATVTGASGTPVTWQVVSGPAGVTLGSKTASFSSPGLYRLRATTVAGSLSASDDINVTVAPQPASVSVTATVPTAVIGGSNGMLSFNRTGATTSALTVSYSVAGTAHSGTDYVALPGTVTLAAGASAVTLPVVPGSAPTPGATVIVNISASPNYAAGISPQAIVSIAGSASNGYASWAMGALSGYSAALQLPTADPAKDSIPNLLKYAFNLDPTRSAVQGLPDVSVTSGNGHTYLTITFTERPNATDLIYTVQVSSNLVNWSSGSSATTQVSSTANSYGTATVVVRDQTPMSTAGQRFIRVQVGQP